MPAKKSDKNKNRDDYALVKVTGYVAPVIFREMEKAMESLGIAHESTYVVMAIKSMNAKYNP